MIYLILISLFVFLMCSNYEYFGPGVGKSFGVYHSPENCEAKNNCFKGSYFRSQIYQDVCQPLCGLNRSKKQLRSNCIKRL
jgi:hypothetical protein